MRRVYMLMSLVVACAMVASCGMNGSKNSSDEEHQMPSATLEFWVVCDDNMTSALTSFLYLEADALVADYYADVLEQEAPVSLRSLLREGYIVEGLWGEVYEVPIGGMFVAAADKESMAQIDEYLELEAVRARLDEITNGEVKLVWSHKNSLNDTNDGIYTLYALQGREGVVPATPAMGGSGITDVRAVKSQYGGYEVSISMDNPTAVAWAELTEANIGRHIAIVVNDRVYSAPMVMSRIDCGQATISGDFSPKEAKALARAIQPR